MWLLGRVIPYLIGENIPEGDINWKNYLQLLEIVDLLMAPEISEDEVGELTLLISQHDTLFSHLYTSSSVLPKHIPFYGAYAPSYPQVSVCVCVCVFVHVCTCMYMCTCMCVRVFVCVFVLCRCIICLCVYVYIYSRTPVIRPAWDQA